MKRFVTALAAAATMAVALPTAASAQAYGSINDRQASIAHRIDLGVSNGALTREEAAKLRAEFGQISLLESQYRNKHHVLSAGERTDLENRLDSLSRRVYVQKHDRDVRR